MAISLKSTVAAPAAAYPALKSSIVLFDCNPGTRSWTVPEGVSQIRAFVVGAGGGGFSGTNPRAGSGGGYSEKLISVTPGQVLSYTVGAEGATSATSPTAGGTSSFAGVISATGGGPGGSAGAGVAGTGSGGDVNTSGGSCPASSASNGGGAAGHKFGNGQDGGEYFGGGFSLRHRGLVDGWGCGAAPGESFGRGATYAGGSLAINAGPGGGGVGSQVIFMSKDGGIGGGGSPLGNGGPGLVGIEVIA